MTAKAKKLLGIFGLGAVVFLVMRNRAAAAAPKSEQELYAERVAAAKAANDAFMRNALEATRGRANMPREKVAAAKQGYNTGAPSIAVPVVGTGNISIAPTYTPTPYVQP